MLIADIFLDQTVLDLYFYLAIVCKHVQIFADRTKSGPSFQL